MVNESLATSGEVLLVSELFPPAIGGSAELLANVYSRLRTARASVLTDGRSASRSPGHEPFREIRERPMGSRRWGVLHPQGLVGYAQIAADIRRMSRDGVTGVHCARVLPEGLSALMARACGGARYACWVHGEELGYIDSSRELRLLAAAVFSRASAIFANSANTAALLTARGIPPARIHIVRPGVDTERFRPGVPGAADLRRQLAGDAKTLCLTVGRLQRRKGHDLVLKALAGLGPKCAGIRYVIAGDGEERSRLEAMIRCLDLGDVVLLRGRVDASELPLYYAAADIFLHPNRVDGTDFEGFGIVFLEAAACGLPAIAGRSGGVPEAVVDGETGTLVSGTDVDELRRALLALVDDPHRRQSMGRAARTRVVREFVWQRAADEVSAIHQQLFG